MDAPEKVDFVINRKAGTVLSVGEEQFVSELRRIFGDRAGQFYVVEGNEVEQMVKQWVKDNAAGGRRLTAWGGDGTLMTVASAAKGSGLTIGFGPAGTQNFLVTNMGFSRDFREAAVQLLNSTTRMLDVGTVNGMDFLVGLVLDKNCVKFFEAREDLREKKFLPFLRKAFSFVSGVLWSPKDTLLVTGGDQEPVEHAGRIFAVTCNALTPRTSEGVVPVPRNFTTIAGNAFGKAEQPDGQLAFYASEAGLTRASAILGSIWNGTWDQSEHVSVVRAPALLISVPGEAPKKIRFVADGELRDTEWPLKITIQPQALRVCTPA